MRRSDEIELRIGREKYKFHDLRRLHDFVSASIEKHEHDQR